MTRRGSRCALALLVATSALVAASKGPQFGKALFVGADPDADEFAGETWIYPTGDGDTLRAWSSPDLEQWTEHEPLLRLSNIAWIADGAPHHMLWAPDMVEADGHYFFYFAVGPQDPTPSRIGVALCDTPAGPCRDSGKPLVTGGNGFEAIDPMVFVDPKSGRRLLYAGGSAGSTLHVYELAPDMITVTREIPVDQPPGFTEGAFMHERRGIYYLSYSSGHWNDASYNVRYAVSLSPTGPWKYAGVILQSDRNYKGPGHHSFLHLPESDSWLIVYHRWEYEMGNGPYHDRRKIAIAPVTYTKDGAIEPIDMEAR